MGNVFPLDQVSLLNAFTLQKGTVELISMIVYDNHHNNGNTSPCVGENDIADLRQKRASRDVLLDL